MNEFTLPDPTWIFLGSLAGFLVFVGLAAFLACALLLALGSRHEAAQKCGGIAFRVGIGTLLFALVAHLALIVTQQYAFEYVWVHTNSQLPTVYRFRPHWLHPANRDALTFYQSFILASQI